MQKIIRASNEQVTRWHAAAEAVGLSWEEWARQQLDAATAAPIIRARYGYQGIAENGAQIRIVRYGEAQNAVQTDNCTPEQIEAFIQAQDLIRRNRAGDRERAVGLLQNAGFNLLEVPVY